MNQELSSLVASILNLSTEDRIEVLAAVFGNELPETKAAEEQSQAADAERTEFRIQGVAVEQGIFELVRDSTGIFSTDQLGMNADQVLEAFEVDQRNRRLHANMRKHLGDGDHWEWRNTLIALKNALGITSGERWWLLPSEDEFLSAIEKLKQTVSAASAAEPPSQHP